MLPQWDFQLATRVRFGRGMLRRLGESAAALGKKALLVGYRDRTGTEEALVRARRSLDAAGLAVSEFLDVPPDPDAQVAEAGAKAAVECGAEVVVGMGGGSVIDAAKGIAALARLGGTLWDYADVNRESRRVTDSLPVVAVPTTAGTGSEVTSVAVFTVRGKGDSIVVAGFPTEPPPRPQVSLPRDATGDVPLRRGQETRAERATPLKASIYGPAASPAAAIVDPDLTLGSPPSLTAACGADALGHAIESCMSRRANPVASLLAERAVGLVVGNLARAVEEPADPGPREALALAATLAGAAFNSAGVTMTHAIAHALGAVLGVPHGRAVAIATPLNLRYSAAECVEVYARLARACSIGGQTPEEQAEAFVARVTGLLHSVGLPDHVEAPPGAAPDLAARLARNAIESTEVALKLNPRKVDEPSLRIIFEGLVRR